MLNWISRFNIFCLLDNHHYTMPLHEHECIAGAGALQAGTLQETALAKSPLAKPIDDWRFGHLGYGLKAETMGVKGGPEDPIGFPDQFFFVPQYVLILREGELNIGSTQQDHQQVYEQIVHAEAPKREHHAPAIYARMQKQEYMDAIGKLRGHILRGDCYEINYCQEFYATDAVINPLDTFISLAAVSPNPFSAFYRLDDKYMMCASPERFIKRTGSKIISQPIKGTIHRDKGDQSKDDQLRDELYMSQKDRSENVMVVDLVRNDLSRICKEGTVKVDELYGIYPFPQVHQMISTISGELEEGISMDEIINACFPMGSMTGAPKKKVLELIDRYETTGRGLFSGSVGYIDPSGNFDLNVVIRSIFFNETKRYLSYLVGSGITYYSDAEKEFEECILKATAMQEALKGIEALRH